MTGGQHECANLQALDKALRHPEMRGQLQQHPQERNPQTMRCTCLLLNPVQNLNNSTSARQIRLNAHFRAQGGDAALPGAARPGILREAQRLKSELDSESHGLRH